MVAPRFTGRFVTMTMKTMAKILLAEDDDDMRNFLVKALQKAKGLVLDGYPSLEVLTLLR